MVICIHYRIQVHFFPLFMTPLWPWESWKRIKACGLWRRGGGGGGGAPGQNIGLVQMSWIHSRAVAAWKWRNILRACHHLSPTAIALQPIQASLPIEFPGPGYATACGPQGSMVPPISWYHMTLEDQSPVNRWLNEDCMKHVILVLPPPPFFFCNTMTRHFLSLPISWLNLRRRLKGRFSSGLEGASAMK